MQIKSETSVAQQLQENFEGTDALPGKIALAEPRPKTVA